LDPKFARAWALLSYVDSYGYITAFLQPTEALREETRQAAATAMALDPDLGEAVLAQGFYEYGCLKNYDAAERTLEQARRLLPNSSRIPEFLAYITRRRGRWNESDDYFRRTEQLDPRNPALLSQHAFSYIHLRRFRDADRVLDAILNITPDDLDSTATKAAIAQCEGDLNQAAAILAPLRPTASNAIAVERQVYQSILERHPGPIIPRLQEILVQSDPGLGYFNGELRLWLGWAQDLAGDRASAVATWQQARDELQSLLATQPENHFLIGDLALIYTLLGDRNAAWSMVDRGFSINPPEKDAVAGPRSIEVLARVAAGTGETDRAITALEKLLAMPVSGLLHRSMPLTPAVLRLDPMFDLIRGDPRFQKLAGLTGTK
jgi:tetratricopeptide (TPR) repeat protein